MEQNRNSKPRNMGVKAMKARQIWVFRASEGLCFVSY